MGLIPQVKCGRCDRSYSGLRSRCPYCGAHRHKKGKRVTDSDNATWKLIIGILLIVVLIAAVIVILVTGSGDSDVDDNNEKVPPSNNGDGPEQTPGGDQEPKTKISVSTSDGNIADNVTMTVGGTTEFTAAVTSEEGETNTIIPVWTSSNEAVVTVTADATGLKASVSGVAAGTAVVTVTAGDAKYEVNVTCAENGSSDVPQTVVASDIKAKSRYHELTGKNNEFTLKLAETQEITAIVTPSNVTSVPTWSSSDESIVAVTPTDETGMKARCTGVSQGSVTITVSVDSVEFTFTVRCSGKS